MITGPDADDLVTCPQCGSGNDSDAHYCDQCDFDLTSTGFRPAPYARDDDETITCWNCGRGDDPDAKFCDQCGVANPGGPSPVDANIRRVGQASTVTARASTSS